MMKFIWSSGKEYEGESAHEIVDRLAHSSPFTDNNLIWYMWKVAKRSRILGKPIVFYSYKTFLEALEKQGFGKLVESDKSHS